MKVDPKDAELRLLRHLEALVRTKVKNEEPEDTDFVDISEDLSMVLRDLDRVKQDTATTCVAVPPTHSIIVIGPNCEIEVIFSEDNSSMSAAWAAIAVVSLNNVEVTKSIKEQLFGTTIA